MDTIDLRRVRLEAVEPGKVQGRDCVGIIEMFCGYRARGVSILGKFGLSRNLGDKTRVVGSPCG